jgi:hypothetical protein
VVKVDAAAHILTWQGLTYRTSDASDIQTESPGCGKVACMRNRSTAHRSGVLLLLRDRRLLADASSAEVSNASCLPDRPVICTAAVCRIQRPVLLAVKLTTNLQTSLILFKLIST